MRCILLLCSMLLAGPALAAEIALTWTPIQGTSAPMAVIKVRGEIKSGDETLFAAVADLASTTKNSVLGMPLIQVDLNSGGGNVTAAMRIGKIIRDRSMWTLVDEPSECASACIFILQAGVTRHVVEGASLGLHRPKFPAEEFASLSASDARTKYNDAMETIHGYWDYVGGKEEAWKMMMATPSNSMTYVTERGMAQFYGLDGMDAATQELSIAKLKVAQTPKYKLTPVDYDPFAPKR